MEINKVYKLLGLMYYFIAKLIIFKKPTSINPKKTLLNVLLFIGADLRRLISCALDLYCMRCTVCKVTNSLHPYKYIAGHKLIHHHHHNCIVLILCMSSCALYIYTSYVRQEETKLNVRSLWKSKLIPTKPLMLQPVVNYWPY